MPYKNKEAQIAYQVQWMKNRRDLWLKDNGPCRECGSCENLEVHHTNPDEKEEHRIWSWSDKRRSEELSKCRVLCQSCHRKETREQVRTPLVHGTLNGYLHKRCRCAQCTQVHSEEMKNWKIKTNYRCSKDFAVVPQLAEGIS